MQSGKHREGEAAFAAAAGPTQEEVKAPSLCASKWASAWPERSRVCLLCSSGFSDDDRMNDLQAPKEGFIHSSLYTGTDIGDGTRSFLRFHRFFQLRGKWEKPKQAQVGRLFAALCPLPE